MKHTSPILTLSAGLLLTLLSVGLPPLMGNHVAVAETVSCAPGAIVHAVMPGVVSRQPPPGFDPLFASNAVLACYGYPVRPDGGPMRRAWISQMRRLRHLV